MTKYYYDLHVHSCLSPCGDGDNTPNNIAGMAHLSGLNVVALTDHNSCKNCPAFFEATKKYNIIPIAGMELTTSEDIHVVCLFENLSDALAFDGYVDEKRVKVKNRPDIFGNQTVLNENDEPLYEIEELLINSTGISVSDIKELVGKFKGVCYPAHVDRDSNGIIAVLGTLPEDCPFDYYELHDRSRLADYSSRYGIPEDRFIVSSDAHRLTDLRDKENYLELSDEEMTDEEIRRQFFEILRRKRI